MSSTAPGRATTLAPAAVRSAVPEERAALGSIAIVGGGFVSHPGRAARRAPGRAVGL